MEKVDDERRCCMDRAETGYYTEDVQSALRNAAATAEQGQPNPVARFERIVGPMTRNGAVDECNPRFPVWWHCDARMPRSPRTYRRE